MENVFIQTVNFQRFQSLCENLLTTQLGLEMAKVIGPAGRGKTFAAERLRTMSAKVVYVRHREWFRPPGLIREICFVLTGTRPCTAQRCFDAIQTELANRRRIIMVDECDRMSIAHLNALRDVHDICRVPVVLIGLEILNKKIESEGTLSSRVSSELRFEPISAGDVAVFYQMSLGQPITAQQAAHLSRSAAGDFRMVVNHGLNIERRMRASGIGAVTDELINEVCGDEAVSEARPAGKRRAA